MLIKYDRLVLEEARKIAAKPNALKRDMFRFLTDYKIMSYGYYYQYLAPEARQEIIELTRALPRRHKLI